MQHRIASSALTLELSLKDIWDFASATQAARDLPLSVLASLPIRAYSVAVMSAAMAAQEKRASIPQASFRGELESGGDRLDRCDTGPTPPIDSLSASETHIG